MSWSQGTTTQWHKMLGNTAFHWALYFLCLSSADTQTTEPERRLLAHYARTSSSLLEIGVYEGFTTRVIAQAMPQTAELFAVDPFFKGRLGISWARQIARAEASKVKKTVHFIELLSKDAAKLIKADFDFMFIDADHSLEGITIDWETWNSRCRVGGIMAFHDTRIAPHAPHVAEFGSFQFYNNVIRVHPNFEVIDNIDTLSVVRRKG